MGLMLADLEIAARTVWMEARGEGYTSQVSCARVMVNRYQRSDGQWKKDHTLGAACLRWMQFSGWNPGDPNREKAMAQDWSSPSMVKALQAVCEALLMAEDDDPTRGATHYKTYAVSPAWAAGKTPCYRDGAHEFYNDVA